MKFTKFVKNKINIFLLKPFESILCLLDKCIPLFTDKFYLSLKYRIIFGSKLNLIYPKTFNEKIQWLKLYDRQPEYSIYVDKYAVREYISKTIGKQFLIPMVGVWNTPEDIDFDNLPKKFVLKTNHDSGTTIICDDKSKLNFEEVKQKLCNGLKKDYYKIGKEWPYKNVPRKIIAEQLMEDSETKDLKDYKFFCFDGKAKIMFIASDRQNENEETKFDFFDMNFKFLNFTHGHPNSKVLPKKPKNFEFMKKLAEKLSKDIPQIRIDFYEINGKVYFGEMTLFHHSGFVPFKPYNWDYILGSWIKLPQKVKNKS